MNFNYLPIQILLFVAFLWPISRVWLRFKENTVKLGDFLFWTGFWLAGVFVIFYPDSLTYFAHLVGVGRGSDLAVYCALLILFYLIFRINVNMENVRHDISKLVREIALMEEKNKQK
ncbi:DUF2304 domain-containing protein [Candidatus Beckwithbacteria bacterium]|nr:DUF2304 domain-containing protein [Candidatus Beckwithbacteria bacterium]